MSEPTDPNAKYEPAPYPRMLYATMDHHIIVHDEADEAQARVTGYRDFEDIEASPADGLDVLSVEALIAIAVGLLRDNLAKTPKPELIAGIRDMCERAAKKAAKSAPAAAQDGPDDPGAEADPFDAMDKKDLRAFIKARDGKNAPGFFDEAKLRDLARNAPTAA